MRLLLVEDDQHVGEALVIGLSRHGHDVQWVTTGQDALEATDFEFALLDLGLPDLDGLEVCKRLRAGSNVPIIAVTARSEELDVVMGLQQGADDYLIKPVGLRELLARIDAVRRRGDRNGDSPTVGSANGPTGGESEHSSSCKRAGELWLDTRTRRVVVAGREMTLTRKEFDLLAELMSDAGAVLTREHLLERVWDMNWIGSTRTLDVHVTALRNKLGDPAWIENVRGVGYRLGAPDG